MTGVAVRPELLRWARERAGVPIETLGQRFPALPAWEAGTKKPTVRQLEDFASATSAPLGYLFLSEPPVEILPLPDCRTLADAALRWSSPDLLETVFAMERRQGWLREYRMEQGFEPLLFVRSVTIEANPLTVASAIRRALGISGEWAKGFRTWADALDELRARIESAGAVVVTNGVVGNNTHRKLDPSEFRGFVLVDEYAPLVFVNGADGKAAQMFTLAHELAHLWVGQDAVFNLRDMQPADNKVERFCNLVAAEFLVPEAVMRQAWNEVGEAPNAYQQIARRFKVSELVVARRALDLGLISRERIFAFYNAYLDEVRRTAASRRPGGNFYATQLSRVGRVFGEAVVRAAREGRLLYTEAFTLTGLSGATFDRFAARLGFPG